MRLHLDNTELLLQENQPLGVVNGKGVTIRCLAGTAWLTVDGEAGDRFLAAGETHRLESDGLALVEAMGRQANIRLEAARPDFRSRVDRLFSRLTQPACRFVPLLPSRQRDGLGMPMLGITQPQNKIAAQRAAILMTAWHRSQDENIRL